MDRVALVLALAACTPGDIVVAPVIENPDDDDATAFGVIDELVISIATEGDERDLATRRFVETDGEELELPGVPFGSNLVMHVTGLRETTPIAYGRTCSFAVAPGLDPVEPHVFFSRSQRFATNRDVPEERVGGQAIVLDDVAYFIGGSAGSLWRFDPRTGVGELATTTSFRREAIGALLGVSPSRLVLIGGIDGASNPVGAVDVFDPRDGVETFDAASMRRGELTATSLADGRVIVIGGRAGAAPPAGTISEIAPDGTGVEIRDVATLAIPRAGHTATRLGDDLGAPVLIAGGRDAAGAAVIAAELFKPLSGTLANPATFDRPMQHPRWGHHAARMPDGSVLIIGGLDAASQPVRALERFTIDEGFVDVVDSSTSPVALPDTVGVIGMTVTELPDGRLLIAGGRTTSTGEPTSAAYVLRLDPRTGTLDFGPTGALGFARERHQAAVLCDGTVLVNGGTPGALAERYNPPPAGRR